MRTPTLLTPTTTEHVLLLSGREEGLPKTTPRFPKWTGEFPWSTYGGKPILDFRGEPLYAEFVILGLLEAEGWSGVWVNSVHRRPFPRRWPPSPIMILPPKVYALHHECLRIVALIALGRVPRIELTANRAIYRIESFRIVGPCTMRVRFDDEAEQTIDFGPILEGEINGHCGVYTCWSRFK